VLVVDASAFVAFLIPEVGRGKVDEPLLADTHWVVPEHFVIEAVQALRGLWLRKTIVQTRLDEALAVLTQAKFDTWPTLPLLPRIRELMQKASAYDAAYIALAEETASPLLTVDGRLSRVSQARCTFVGVT
jgi:predicted nucleic acid-binding protein